MSDCLKVWNVKDYIIFHDKVKHFLYQCWRKGYKTNKIIEEVHKGFGDRFTNEEIMTMFREVWEAGLERIHEDNLQALDGKYEG